jgi:hypothetical protein
MNEFYDLENQISLFKIYLLSLLEFAIIQTYKISLLRILISTDRLNKIRILYFSFYSLNMFSIATKRYRVYQTDFYR